MSIIIDCGPYKEHANFRNEFGTYCWAVRATVKAKMIFNICDMSPMDEDSAVWGKVSGCFERLLVMPVKHLSHKTYYYDRGLTDRGVVTIQLSNLIDVSGNITNDSMQNQSGKVVLNSTNDVDDKNDTNNDEDNDEDFLDNIDSFIKDDSIVAEDLDAKDENVDVLIEATKNEHLVDKHATVGDVNENGWEDEDQNGWEDIDIDEHTLDSIYEAAEKNEGEEYDEKNILIAQHERRIKPETIKDQDFIKQQEHKEADNDDDNGSGWGDDDDVFDDLA